MTEKMKINHISVSREGTWKECPKKYHYHYHLGLRPDVEPIYFLYGKVVHKIIETYVLAKGQTNINEVMNSVLSGKIALEEGREAEPGKPPVPPKYLTKPLPMEYRQKLPHHISSFLKLNKVLGFDCKTEWKFNYDLDPPNNRCLTGFIDQLFLYPVKCFILDFKTTKQGKYRKNARTIKDDLQLQCYAKIVQKEFHYPADQITCALYYLDGGELISTKFSQKAIDSVEVHMLQTYKEIEATDADKAQGRVGEHCYRCDFKRICPFYGNKTLTGFEDIPSM